MLYDMQGQSAEVKIYENGAEQVMKVLWVCNVMLPAVAEYFGQKGSNKEGWLDGLCSVILERQKENHIDLHVAFPVAHGLSGFVGEIATREGCFHAYGFYEDVNHAEEYDPKLETCLKDIIELARPDVIHCFGTEYAHTLAVLKCAPKPERVLVGIQGLCGVIAEAYMADLPKDVQCSRTFRDVLKKDSLCIQQEKFAKRGKREAEILQHAQNVTGRTDFDHAYVEKYNPQAKYFVMNETLRSCFYESEWVKEGSVPYSIFVSQGDYPLKGLHYLLLAAAKLVKTYPGLQIYVAGNSVVNHGIIKGRVKISSYGKYLRSLIRTYHLRKHVHFTGQLTAPEMRARYLQSSVFVCCSSNENSPNSLGEAMLLGMPCVAADVGGISSLFTDNEDGILYAGYESETDDINNTCDECDREQHIGCDFPKTKMEEKEQTEETGRLFRNADNLCRAISKIWENPDETARFCENARNHAKKTHDREANYQKMMEIYANITAE